MTNLVCSHCGRTIFETVYGCKEIERPCGRDPFGYRAYAHRFDRLKNSPEFIARTQADWNKIFGHNERQRR